ALRLIHRDSLVLGVIADNRVLLALLDSTRLAFRRIRQKLTQKAGSGDGSMPGPRAGFLKVIDSFLVREFFKYFALILLICVALFIVFTLFDLVDDSVSNHISLSIVADYFWYLLPHVLTLVVPLSVLIAALA